MSKRIFVMLTDFIKMPVLKVWHSSDLFGSKIRRVWRSSAKNWLAIIHCTSTTPHVSSIRLMHGAPIVDWRLSREPPRISPCISYCHKLEFLLNISAVDSIRYFYLFSRSFFGKRRCEKPRTKTETNVKWPFNDSRSFKVTILRSVETSRGTTCLLHSNFGLISKASVDIVTQSTKNCRFRVSTHTLYRQKPSLCYTFLLPIAWAYLYLNFHGGLGKKDMYFETECVLAIQGHPGSLILTPIESAYATSY